MVRKAKKPKQGRPTSLFRRERVRIPAVKQVSFDIYEGELVGFLGPNGAGKTTTLKMLSGILYPTSGEASVLGYIPWKRQKAFQQQFSLVMGQKNQLWWDLPAKQTFLLNKVIYDVSDVDFRTRVDELSQLLNVSHLLDTPVRQLSLGERMKCEIISALIHQPSVLFLDEPTIGLDVVSQQTIRQFIREYNRTRKTTIILTSHYMDDVEALCSRVIIISDGQIIFDGSLKELISKYSDTKRITVSFRSPVQKKDLPPIGTIAAFEPIRAVIDVPTERHRELAAQLLTNLSVDDILIDEVSIDEIIRQIFGKKGVE